MQPDTRPESYHKFLAKHDNEVLPSRTLIGAYTGAALMLQITTAVDGTSIERGPEKFSPWSEVTGELPKLRCSSSSETSFSDLDLLLPPKNSADEFLKIYLDIVDSIFPWLERHAMDQAYATLWVNDQHMEMDTRVFHCTLNLMFALAWIFGPFENSKLQARSAAAFYSRAEKLMLSNLVEIYAFENIQILLLSALYHQTTSMSQRCFQSISLAIYVAQSIGLHLPATTSALKRPREQEIARRVWHGCLIIRSIQ
jgi:hypothetical protein